MKLPVRFPNDAAVIVEQTAQFRALSAAQRIRSIRGLLTAGALLMSRSPKEAFLREQTVVQENLARQAVKEFLSRHGNKT